MSTWKTLCLAGTCFSKSPVFFGREHKFKIKTCQIYFIQFLAHKPVNFVSLIFELYCTIFNITETLILNANAADIKQLSGPEKSKKLPGLSRNGTLVWGTSNTETYHFRDRYRRRFEVTVAKALSDMIFVSAQELFLVVKTYNPRQKSLKHPFPLCKVEMTFPCFTGYNNIGKGRGTEVVRQCSKCFKVFV